MTQIKRVPFDYKYFKQHPETKLETKNGKVAHLIGEKKIGDKYPLVFESETVTHFSTTLNGKYDIRNDNNNFLDIFMLLEPKKEVRYYNVHDDYIAGHYNSLDESIESHCDGAKSVAKLIIVDGKIDFKKSETVHKY